MLTKLADLSYRLYDWMRDRRAFQVANEPGTAAGFDAFEGRHYCLVISFKRSGEAVPTPVVFGLAGGKL